MASGKRLNINPLDPICTLDLQVLGIIDKIMWKPVKPIDPIVLIYGPVNQTCPDLSLVPKKAFDKPLSASAM